jgi:hypothetical protein
VISLFFFLNYCKLVMSIKRMLHLVRNNDVKKCHYNTLYPVFLLIVL